MPELASSCPHLKRVGNETHYSIQGYCRRPSRCELRVPSIWEFRLLCTTKNYIHCPMYRSGREAAKLPGLSAERKIKR